jgi:hypothetical protein
LSFFDDMMEGLMANEAKPKIVGRGGCTISVTGDEGPLAFWPNEYASALGNNLQISRVSIV